MENSKDKEKVIQKFESDVKDARDLLKDFEDLVWREFSGKKDGSPYKPINPDSQYSDIIYWYHVSFDEKIRKNLCDAYKDIEGFNIMPYQITIADIEKAKAIYKSKTTKKDIGFRSEKTFPEMIKDKPEYVDFDDGNSANFHKKPDGNYQIVLTSSGPSGPGWVKTRINNTDDSKSRINKIKTEYYYPRLDSNDLAKTDGKGIFDLIESALNDLGIKKSNE